MQLAASLGAEEEEKYESVSKAEGNKNYVFNPYVYVYNKNKKNFQVTSTMPSLCHLRRS